MMRAAHQSGQASGPGRPCTVLVMAVCRAAAPQQPAAGGTLTRQAHTCWHQLGHDGLHNMQPADSFLTAGCDGSQAYGRLWALLQGCPQLPHGGTALANTMPQDASAMGPRHVSCNRPVQAHAVCSHTQGQLYTEVNTLINLQIWQHNGQCTAQNMSGIVASSP